MRRNGRTLVAYFVASRSFPFLSRLTPHYPHLTPTSRLTRLRRLPPGGSETGGGKVRGRGRRQQNQGSKIDRRDGFSVFLPSRRPPSLTVCLSGPPFSTLTPVPPSFPFVSPYALSSSCHSTFCSVPFRRDERSEGGSEVTSDRVSGERNRHGERDERWTGVTDGD